VLSQHSELRIVPIRERLTTLKEAGELVWPDLDSLVAGNYLRTFPGIHPCDGFFAAMLERRRH
jgi:16S rRNA (cytosine967-C5)-methyltransferase